MGVSEYWQEFVCFGIVGASIFGSVYVISRKEVSGRGEQVSSLYESLVMSRPDEEGYAEALPRGHVGSYQLWTSCWLDLHPAWLFGIRVVSFCVLAGFLLWDFQDWGGTIFFYYTEWTYHLTLLYFAIGSVISGHGCWMYHKMNTSASEEIETTRLNVGDYRIRQYRGAIKLQSHYYQEEVLKRAGFWGYLMQISYQTCAGAVILIDIVFWCVLLPFLSDAHFGLYPLMSSMHTFNVVFLLLDASVNSIRFPWFRLAYFVLWSSTYAIFQWVIHACGFPWWPYAFLELSTPLAPVFDSGSGSCSLLWGLCSDCGSQEYIALQMLVRKTE
ncbi:hypothetical protein V2J09_022197 [Rumex salicifolius]